LPGGEVLAHEPGQGVGEDDRHGGEGEPERGPVVVNGRGGQGFEVGEVLGVEQDQQPGDPVGQRQGDIVQVNVNRLICRVARMITAGGAYAYFKQTQDMAARRSFDETFKERQASQDLPRTCDEMIDWLWQGSFNCHAATRNLVRDIQALLVGEKSPLRCDSSEIPEMEW
jgi:hypothetical protein